MIPITLDPTDPPEGVELTDAERLLYDGKCPSCGARPSFEPLIGEEGGGLQCMACGVEFAGPEADRSGKTPMRRIETVYKAGDPAKRGGAPDSLPPVVARPERPPRPERAERRVASPEQEP